MQSIRVSNALELRNFLNSLPEDQLQKASVRATYSENVKHGDADVGFAIHQAPGDGQYIELEIVGSADAV